MSEPSPTARLHLAMQRVRALDARRPPLWDALLPALLALPCAAQLAEGTWRNGPAGGRTRVLILTTFDPDEYAYAGLRAGASGFLVKDAQPAELLAGIRAVAGGDAVVAPALTRRLLDAFADRLPGPGHGDGNGDGSGPVEDPRLAALTEREREVLTAIGRAW